MKPCAQGHPLAGWIPWRIHPPTGLLEWLPLDQAPYREPSFEETLLRLKQRSNRVPPVRTSLDLLAWNLEGLERVEPRLFLFHVSRCGSTLLAQLLALDPGLVVVSEAPLLDHLLRAGRDDLVPPLLALLGQRRFQESEGLIVKLDSWALAFHARLRRLYPGVPFAFLHRSPAEVTASQRRMRGLPSLPGSLPPELFGFDAGSLPRPRPGIAAEAVFDAYFEQVLARYYAWMEEAAATDPGSLLVDFGEGPGECHRALLRHAGLELPEALLPAIQARCLQHGKRPWEAYRPAPPAPAAPQALEAAHGRLRALSTGGDHAGG